jgi:hypothetical protein
MLFISKILWWKSAVSNVIIWAHIVLMEMQNFGRGRQRFWSNPTETPEKTCSKMLLYKCYIKFTMCHYLMWNCHFNCNICHNKHRILYILMDGIVKFISDMCCDFLCEKKSHSLVVLNVVDYTSYREELFTLGWNSLGIVESVTKTHRCMHRRGRYYSLILQCAMGREEGFSVMLSSVDTEGSCWHPTSNCIPSFPPPSIWKLINNVCSAPHSTQLHGKVRTREKS